jgi:hypothetical protein
MLLDSVIAVCVTHVRNHCLEIVLGFSVHSEDMIEMHCRRQAWVLCQTLKSISGSATDIIKIQ